MARREGFGEGLSERVLGLVATVDFSPFTLSIFGISLQGPVETPMEGRGLEESDQTTPDRVRDGREAGNAQ